jgi:hypothetical protein
LEAPDARARVLAAVAECRQAYDAWYSPQEAKDAVRRLGELWRDIETLLLERAAVDAAQEGTEGAEVTRG